METPVVSRPWIKTTVTGDIDAITAARLAFVTHAASPDDSDWNTADVTDAGVNDQGEPQVDVRIRVGPGGDIELDPATYRMWVELDAHPELIREPAPGEVRITP